MTKLREIFSMRMESITGNFRINLKIDIVNGHVAKPLESFKQAQRYANINWKKKLGKFTILAKTKTPSASQRHTPIPVRLWEEEKATSTLHLSRPWAGFYQPTGCVSDVLASLEIEVTRYGCSISVPFCPSGIFASFHSVTITRSRSTTVAQRSVTSSRTLRFWCFHKLHRTLLSEMQWGRTTFNLLARTLDINL